MSSNSNPVPLTGEEKVRVESQKDGTEEIKSPLKTDQGDTTIDDKVVAKLAEIAAREVEGVYAMGTATQRTISNIAGRISGNATAGPSGVNIKKGDFQTAVDLTIVVEYGYSIVEVAEGIRSNIINSVEHATGLEVVEVNIDVSDVHIPGDDDEDSNGDLK